MKRFLFATLLLALSFSAFAVSPVTVGFSYAGADILTYNVTGFSIERKTEACAGNVALWGVVGTTGPGVRSFVDATVIGSTTYCYRVRAVNAVGVSAPSNTAEKTTAADLPVPPTSVTAT